MSTVRLRRLTADYENLKEYVRRQPRVQLMQADGDPPERYQLEYKIRSLRRVDEQLKAVTSHLVEILLPGSYPRLPPQCRMLTPIFHPNIAPHAICIGDHWSAGEPLPSLVARIGEMIAYQSYNTKSPLNGEAARWVTEHVHKLPLDPVSLLVEEERETASQSSNAAAPPEVKGAPAAARPSELAVAEEHVTFPCPECAQTLRVPARLAGKRSRCPRCQAIFRVPL